MPDRLVLNSKPQYIDAEMNWEDPLYRKIVDALPASASPATTSPASMSLRRSEADRAPAPTAGAMPRVHSHRIMLRRTLSSVAIALLGFAMQSRTDASDDRHNSTGNEYGFSLH